MPANHPVLQGVEPFETPTKLYKNPHIADDTKLLLTGTIPDHTEPLAWTRERNGGRVFYTSLGGPEDFEMPVFLQLVGERDFLDCESQDTDLTAARQSKNTSTLLRSNEPDIA